MSDADNRNWEQLFNRLDASDKLAHERHTALEAAMGSLRKEQAASQKWHEEHEGHHGLGDTPPRATVANVVAYGLHYPGRVATLVGVWLGAPAVLALSLALMFGPGGGLRVLLQQAGIRAVYVPTPEPSRVP